MIFLRREAAVIRDVHGIHCERYSRSDVDVRNYRDECLSNRSVGIESSRSRGGIACIFYSIEEAITADNIREIHGKLFHDRRAVFPSPPATTKEESKTRRIEWSLLEGSALI